MTKKPDYQRLARAVVERRNELGLGQDDIKALGGPSSATMRSIEHGQSLDRQMTTTWGLERILGWRTGSIAAILRGEEPSVLANPDYSRLRGPHPAGPPVADVLPLQRPAAADPDSLAARLVTAGIDQLTERQVDAIVSVVEAMLPASAVSEALDWDALAARTEEPSSARRGRRTSPEPLD